MRNWKTAGVRNLQKGLVWLLAAILLVTMLPLAGLAAGKQNPGNAPAFLSAFTAHAASDPTSGECGDSARWSFNKKTGTLTISGSGAMWDWENPEDEETEYIAPWIVYYYDSIKSITINSGITALGDYSFAYCESLTGVSIPNTVKEIGEGAFYSCILLKSITIPNSVTTIYDLAFTACVSLQNVSVPASVTVLAGSAFAGCISMKSIQFASGNAKYKSVDGVVFTKDGTTLLIYPAGKTDHIYKVPAGTEKIGEMAFFLNPNIRAVSIPDGVKDIDEGAFAYAGKLFRIFIPLSMVNIREAAFSECTALTDVYYASEDGPRAMMNVSYTDNDPLHHAEWHYNTTAEDMMAALFEDVSKSMYYYESVNWAACAGVTSGTSDITFSPNDNCTRAQAVTFLWRANGSEKVEGMQNPFDDVKTSDYYYDAVLWAVKNDVTNGMTETTFGPNAECTRGQIVTFLWRAAKQPESAGAVSFQDVNQDVYYYKAVQWAVEQGVTNGMTETTFGPNAECTRGQIVTFLFRAQNKYTVTFEANGGDSVSPASKQLISGGSYGTLPTPTRAGYAFTGWFTESEGGTEITSETKVNLTMDQTLYAHWIPGTYTVRFNTEGGETGGTVDPRSIQVTNGSTYGTLPTPTMDRYAFDGWYTAKTGGTEITAETKVELTGGQTLYAHWTLVGTIADSWDQIIESVNNGTYKNKYKIGDTKALDLGSEGMVEMQIAAFDTDELADGSGKAPITWISKQYLNSWHRMNPLFEEKESGSPKYVEGTGNIGGWKHSEMRTWLQSDIKALIPSDVMAAIRPVTKYSSSHDAEGNWVQNDVSIDDLWIPSMREVGGTWELYENEGPVYSELFASNSDRIKRNNDFRGEEWWLRTAIKTTFEAFQPVNENGSFYNNNSAVFQKAVVFGFCM